MKTAVLVSVLLTAGFAVFADENNSEKIPIPFLYGFLGNTFNNTMEDRRDSEINFGNINVFHSPFAPNGKIRYYNRFPIDLRRGDKGTI